MSRANRNELNQSMSIRNSFLTNLTQSRDDRNGSSMLTITENKKVKNLKTLNLNQNSFNDLKDAENRQSQPSFRSSSNLSHFKTYQQSPKIG